MRAPTAQEWERMPWHARRRWESRPRPAGPDRVQRPDPLTVTRTRAAVMVTDGICTAWSTRPAVAYLFAAQLRAAS